ncbi:hypothetical protein O6H91_17G053100 [Diphasiastrum complanatum]|uniref:Uncharacterized protein n=1 Tax=Diphasiastrum complanatum TaxID=34168 RepID=A0ACC2B6W5_DIPCM|nr:hypothetical protein O6H91_17G053100 [Diphasiastrum complanatum]
MKVHPIWMHSTSSWGAPKYMNGRAFGAAQYWTLTQFFEPDSTSYEAMKFCRSSIFLLLGKMGRSLCFGTIEESARGCNWKRMQLQPFYCACQKEAFSLAQKPTLKTLSLRVHTSSPSPVRPQKMRDPKAQDSDLKHLIWWEKQMKLCKKPVTKEMVKRLAYTNLLGLDGQLKRGSSKEGTLNSELLDVKRRFPCEVLLCRVGEFYEAMGFDACVLVEYAGLNPMGGVRNASVPKAGCPIMNLRQTLNELNLHGFSVCIVEEVQGPSHARQRKDRFVAGHAHPGSPYVYGLAGADLDLEFPEPVPVIGISRSIRGYCMISVLETMRTYSVEDGLTEEAVVAKLRARQYQHLYLHRSLREDSTDLVRWGEHGEGGILWGECDGKVWEWLDKDPVTQLLSKVREFFDIDVSEEFRKIVPPSANRPQPLYVGTASQIGILPTPGVPSLLKVLIPLDTPGLCKEYLRDLLLNPPPYHIAAAIQAACRLMADVTSAVPEFSCVSASKLVKLIGAKEVNQLEFSRIRNMAEDVLCLDKHECLGPILDLLLQPTSLATGLHIARKQLVDDCRELANKIGYVLTSDTDPDQAITKGAYIPDEFFQDMEYPWRGRVKRKHAEEAYSEVEKTAASLFQAVEDDFVPVVRRARAVTSSVGHVNGAAKGEICYNRDNQAIWFKGKHFRPLVWAETPGEKEIKCLETALDVKGKKAGEDWYTTKRVEEALERYREAVENAKSKVIEIMRNLSEELKGYLNTIVYTAVLSIIARSLFAHAREGKRRTWKFPNLVFDKESSPAEFNPEVTHRCTLTRIFDCSIQVDPTTKKLLLLGSGRNDQLLLIDLVPYWLDKTKDIAIANSVCIDSLVLLTGPNGGGKSSILRSVCAAAVLGLCGLMVPASGAVIPFLDSIMLRMMSHDSPADGKSSFQMEMSELRSLLTEATKKSLILVDELCKGTEVQKGTCIVASVIETLDHIGCKSILSTHLHGLLQMELQVKNVIWKAMGTQENHGKVIPTWKLVDGICMESLAFETAQREGVPENVLRRAKQLYDECAQKPVNCELLKCGSSSPLATFYGDGSMGLQGCQVMPAAETVINSKNLGRDEAGMASGGIFSGQVNEKIKVTDTPPRLASDQNFEEAISPDLQLNAECLSSPFLRTVSSDRQQMEEPEDPCENSGGKRMLLKDVQHVFLSLSISKLHEIYQRSPDAAAYSLDNVVCRHVAARQRPPPATTNQSCIYMLQRADGKFYVGQTDDLVGRIARHRSFSSMKDAPFIYLAVANKSVASELETVLINRLPLLGLDLINKCDHNHRYFGTASGVSPPF